MESQLQNPEFRINPENFHPCYQDIYLSLYTAILPDEYSRQIHF